MTAKIYDMPLHAQEPVLSMREEIDVLKVKFIDLLREANRLGFNGAYVLGAHDPFGSRTEIRFGSIGDPYAVYGLVHAFQKTI